MKDPMHYTVYRITLIESLIEFHHFYRELPNAYLRQVLKLYDNHHLKPNPCYQVNFFFQAYAMQNYFHGLIESTFKKKQKTSRLLVKLAHSNRK